MREIKFRAWDRVEKKMLQVNLLDWRYPSGLEVNQSNVSLPTTLMQYTELKDKNGKEIYEFDLIKITPNKAIGVVSWCNDGYWGVKLRDSTDNIYAFSGGTGIKANTSEVIGNKFENSDLLEGTKWKK